MIIEAETEPAAPTGDAHSDPAAAAAAASAASASTDAAPKARRRKQTFAALAVPQLISVVLFYIILLSGVEWWESFSKYTKIAIAAFFTPLITGFFLMVGRILFHSVDSVHPKFYWLFGFGLQFVAATCARFMVHLVFCIVFAS